MKMAHNPCQAIHFRKARISIGYVSSFSIPDSEWVVLCA